MAGLLMDDEAKRVWQETVFGSSKKYSEICLTEIRIDELPNISEDCYRWTKLLVPIALLSSGNV
jgi:hypothetical protein